MRRQIALTIAGSDSSGGAGIQADIKTFSQLGVYGATVLTALTAQNTTGVQAILEVSPDFVAKQLQSVFSDLTVASVKTGMLATSPVIREVAHALVKHRTPLVIDPVMRAKGGAVLINEDAVAALIEKLFPLATMVTPNTLEAEVLAGHPIHSKSDVERAAGVILKLGPEWVLIKGGHLNEDATDRGDVSDFLLGRSGESRWVSQPRVETCHTHGTGCTLSAAIASFLALGEMPLKAYEYARTYLTRALMSGTDMKIGRGIGPTDHLWNQHPS